MQSVSAKFLATLRIGHNVYVAATAYIPGVSGGTPLQVIDGSMTVDRTAMTRRTGTITILSSDPALPVDVRTFPRGTYIDLVRGIMFADSTIESVHVGYLRVESVSVDALDQTAQIELQDSMAQIDNTEFQTAYTVSGLTPTAAITQLVRDVFPAMSVSVTLPPSQSALADTHYQSGRAQAIADLAAAIGCEAYFDHANNFIIRPLPVLAGAGVWAIDANDTGVLTAVTDQTDRTDTVNGVLVRGRSVASHPPVSALVTTASGPYAWGGPYGQVLRIVDSSAVATVTQARATATAILNSQLGLGRSLTLQAIPNPAVATGDTVAITFPNGKTELHLIDTIVIPLTPTDAMELTTRSLLASGA